MGTLLIVVVAILSASCSSSPESSEDVQFSQYEEAVLTTVACMKDQGIPFSEDPSYNDDSNIFEFVYGPMEDEAALAAADRIYDECAAQHLDEIEFRWSEQNLPSDAEVQRYEAQMRTCLSAKGLNYPAEVSDSEAIELAIQEDSISVVECQDETPR